jgi:hypothetical protein
MPFIFYSDRENKEIKTLHKDAFSQFCHDMAFNPDQPRDPKGTETGGQWKAIGGIAQKSAGYISKKLVATSVHSEITGDADAMIYEVENFNWETPENSLGVVRIIGGETLITKLANGPTHGQMIRTVYPLEDVDDFVRFIYYEGKLEFWVTRAGVPVGNTEEWSIKAMENIEKSLTKLKSRGFPSKIPVKIWLANETIMETNTL